ncbi:MAG: hypothetical protein Ta2A_10100 [Treponemataceae bacterium]|nr:MAG: hypothetical protein Ta2A_10100 [Treponemataceae bacterium]
MGESLLRGLQKIGFAEQHTLGSVSHFSEQIKAIRENTSILKGLRADIKTLSFGNGNGKNAHVGGGGSEPPNPPHSKNDNSFGGNEFFSPSTKRVVQNAIAQSFVTGIGLGLKKITQLENRSSMFSAAASGNITSVGVQSLERRADVTETAFKTAGSVVGMINPLAGAAVSLAGELISYKDKIDAARMQTRNTLSESWLGAYPAYKQNSSIFGITAQQSFKNGIVGEYYGKNSQEMAELSTGYAKRSGIVNHSVVSRELQNILNVNQGTGADIAALIDTSSIFKRYGEKNTTQRAYNGNLAMGGNNATLEEYTRSMSKVFQNDLSKGIVRGNENVAKSITGMSNYLFNASGGNNMAYRNSENIARINTGVSDAIAGATDVGDATQMMMMRNASSYYGKNSKEVNARLRKAGYNVDGMDRANIVMAMANDSSFANDLFGANTQYINNMYGRGSAYAAIAQQAATGQGYVFAQQSLQGNSGDLKPIIGSDAFPAYKRTASDEALTMQAHSQNVTQAGGNAILPKALEDMKYSLDALYAEMGKTNINLKNLNETLRVN